MDKIDKSFFRETYPVKFGKELTAEKQGDIYQIIDEFDADPFMKSLRWLAYILATGMHESFDTFKPVVEGFYLIKKLGDQGRIKALYNYYLKNNRNALESIFPNDLEAPYYYGRGRVTQLTHDYNYKFASLQIFKDERLLENPELIITDLSVDMKITFEGMREGWFRGTKNRLETFFPLNEQTANWIGARDIINAGRDQANLIASYAMKFYDCLKYEQEQEAHKAVALSLPDPNTVRAEAEHYIVQMENLMQYSG